MRRKDVNRCRRAWDVLAPELHLNKPAAEWARRWGSHILAEIKRLREELKLRNKKRRHVYAKLELERDDLDALLDELEKLRDEIPADPISNVSAWWLNEKLNKIMAPYMEDHDDGDD